MNDGPEEMSYDDLSNGISTAPLTWLPALLITTVEACIKKHVFKSANDLLIVVKKVTQRAEQPGDGRIG